MDEKCHDAFGCARACDEFSSKGGYPLAMATQDKSERQALAPTRREELFAFIVLAVLIWPIIAVGTVGGYGFLIWMYQIVFGPPGSPQPH